MQLAVHLGSAWVHWLISFELATTLFTSGEQIKLCISYFDHNYRTLQNELSQTLVLLFWLSTSYHLGPMIRSLYAAVGHSRHTLDTGIHDYSVCYSIFVCKMCTEKADSEMPLSCRRSVWGMCSMNTLRCNPIACVHKSVECVSLKLGMKPLFCKGWSPICTCR